MLRELWKQLRIHKHFSPPPYTRRLPRRKSNWESRRKALRGFTSWNRLSDSIAALLDAAEATLEDHNDKAHGDQ